MIEALAPAFIACCLLALLTGPAGAFVIWRRMAFFGDTLAHAALLGVGIALLLQAPALLGIASVAMLVSVVLYILETRSQLHSDTLLAVLSYTALASGLIVLYLNPQNISIEALLFGDLLLVSYADIVAILAVLVASSIFLFLYISDLLLMSLHTALAQAEGIAVKRLSLLFNLLIALIVAVSMKAVGALLISALLVIPAAAARLNSRSPKTMILLSTVLSLASVLVGFAFSWFLDVPSGPAMILVAASLFIASFTLSLARHRKAN